MSRIRTVKPEIATDPRLAARSDTARLLYYTTLAVVDDAGRALAAPSYLHGVAFWGAPRSLEVVTAAIAELADAGIWRLYAANGGEYLEVIGWNVKGSICHQRIDKASPSGIPAPTPDSAKPPRKLREASRNIPRPTTTTTTTTTGTTSGTTSGAPVAPAPLVLVSPSSGASEGEQQNLAKDHARARDHYKHRFREATSADATWAGRQGKQLADLLAQHDADEVIRRVDVMFDAPPAWPRDRDFDTFSRHFDKFASPTHAHGRAPMPSTTDYEDNELR